MQLVNAQTGQLEEVPDASALSALKAGTHGLDSTKPVPVKDSFGNITQVPAAEVEGAIGKGGSLASQEEARAADLEARHGGIGGQTAAALEGVVRGLTLGISDPLAIKAAEVFGGKGTADAVRKHLSEEQEAHPTISKVAEVAGAVAPIIATAGEAGVAEAPEIAGLLERGAAAAAKPSLLTTVAKFTPAGITGRLGASVERATAEVLASPAATSALGRIARAAASTAASGGVENAIYSAGGQLSEDALGDHDTTGQKLLAALGHGFVWGALLGGGTGGLSRAGAEAAGPLLRKAVPHLEAKAGETAWHALGGTEREAAEAAEVGGTKAVGKTVLEKTGLHNGGLHDAVLNSEEIAPKLDMALAKQREQIDSILQTHGAKPGEIKIPDLGEIRHLRANGGLDAIDLQARKFAVPELKRAELKELAQDYERLLIARHVNASSLEAKAAREAANPALKAPITPNAMMAAGISALHGNIPAAASILASSAAKKLAAERGQMLAAVTMSKIAHMDFLARAVNTVDKDLEGAAGVLVGKKPLARANRFGGPDRDAPAAAKYEHAHAQDDSTMATVKHWEKAFPGLKAQAPKVTHAALRALNAAAMYTTMARPKRLDKPTLVDPRPKPRVNSVAAEDHYELVRAVHDPVGTLADGIESGTLSRAQVNAIAQTSPKILDTLKQKALDELSKPHKPLTDAQVRTLETLFRGAGDELSSPEMHSMIVAAYAPPPGGAAPSSAVTPTRQATMSRPVKGFEDAAKTKLERTQTGS